MRIARGISIANISKPLSTAIAYDADATAFFTAASITDTTQKNAVNTLVISLKSANIWTKMKALYPIVGGVASSHAVNLKQPGTFNLSFATGWTHSSTGMTPNGATYADTSLIQNSALLQNDYSFGLYSRTNKTGNLGVSTGIVQAAGYTYLYLKNTSNNLVLNMNGLSEFTFSNTDSRGFYQSIRNSSTVIKQLKNVTINNSFITSTINHSIPFFLGARNQDSTATAYDNCELAFSYYGYSLTDAEALSFYNAVQTYQTTLGRNV